MRPDNVYAHVLDERFEVRLLGHGWVFRAPATLGIRRCAPRRPESVRPWTGQLQPEAAAADRRGLDAGDAEDPGAGRRDAEQVPPRCEVLYGTTHQEDLKARTVCSGSSLHVPREKGTARSTWPSISKIVTPLKKMLSSSDSTDKARSPLKKMSRKHLERS